MNLLNIYHEQYQSSNQSAKLDKLLTSETLTDELLAHSLRSNFNTQCAIRIYEAAEKYNTLSFKVLKACLKLIVNDNSKFDSKEAYISLIKRGRITQAKGKDVSVLALDINPHFYEQIILFFKSNLTKSTVYGAYRKDILSNIRNNENSSLSIPNNFIPIAILERLVADKVNRSIKYMEPAVIQRYKNGHYFDWHFDAIDERSKQFQSEKKIFGQRYETAILYLNETFSGGETAFSDNQIITPKTGHLVSFKNVHENAFVNRHKGNIITKGEKWIITFWFRERSYWLREDIFNLSETM